MSLRCTEGFEIVVKTLAREQVEADGLRYQPEDTADALRVLAIDLENGAWRDWDVPGEPEP